MESIVILAGNQDVGKTTTLREFAKGLLLSRNDNPAYQSNINNFFDQHVNNGVNDDLWLIIPTKKGDVFVATKGDDDNISTANAAFFRRNYEELRKCREDARIFTFDNKGNVSEVEMDLPSHFPYQCFTSSRPDMKTIHPLLLCAKEHSFLGEAIIISMRAKDVNKLQERVARYKAVLDRLF